MFHEEPIGLPPPPPPPEPPPHGGVRPWRLRDLAAGVLLAVIGILAGLGATIAVVLGGNGRDDARTVMLVLGMTLLLEAWLGGIVLLLARLRRIPLRVLGLGTRGGPTRALDHQWSYVMLALFGAYACVLGYAGAVTLIEQATGTDLSGIMEGNQIPDDLPRTLGVWIVVGLATVVAAPLGEELFFRGFVYRGLADRFGAVVGIVVSGIAFSLVHLNVSVIVPFAAIGMVFAWVYRASGSLWTTIAAHAIFNGVSFVATVYGVGS